MHLDLNLLTALDALLEEGSVMGAARRLHLSPPAMSRTLGRIRDVTNDQILVRTGRTMTPTPHALALRPRVRAALTEATAVLAPDRLLDLSTLERTFTLQVNDAIVNAVAADLLRAVRAEAPQVRLRVLGEAVDDTDDLRHGRVDLQITASTPAQAGVSWEDVGHDRLIVVARPGHPCAATGLTLEEYSRASHVVVSRRGRMRDPADEALARHGLTRRVVATVPTSTAALYMAHHDDLLVTGPERMCRFAVALLGLDVLPLPFKTAPLPVVMAWHQRYDDDPAHGWLRQHARDVVVHSLGTDRP